MVMRISMTISMSIAIVVVILLFKIQKKTYLTENQNNNSQQIDMYEIFY